MNRQNPFIDYHSEKLDIQSIPILTPWEWNLDGLVANGRCLSFSRFKGRPNVFRPLLSALWENDVQSIPPPKFSTITEHRSHLLNFEQYLSTHPNAAIRDLSSLTELKRETLLDFRSWMHDHYTNTTAGKCYRLIAKLLKALQGINSPMPGTISPELEIPIKSLRRHNADSNKIASPYTPDEEAAITAACKKAMNEVLHRLNEGARLLSLGQDPRASGIKKKRMRTFSDGWKSIPNLLWYVMNVLDGRMLNRRYPDGSADLLTRFTTDAKKTPINRAGLYELLYPSPIDIVPFIVLLSLKTGLNAESIMTLKRDCLLSSDKNTTRVRYSKERGGHDQLIRNFSHRGATSPCGIIKTVLRMTEHLNAVAPNELSNELWLSHQYTQGQQDGEYHTHAGQAAVFTPRYLRALINGSTWGGTKKRRIGFMERHGVRNRNAEFLKFSFLIARKTEATNEYLKHGNLANVSKRILKHHGAQALNTTTIHYLTNEATHHVHNQAVRNAQDKTVAQARGAVIDEQSEKTAIALLAENLSESEEKIMSVLRGEQDVFLAACRDFYNRPGGIPNTPCSDPWECFACSNALWTSRILPRLIKFSSFMEEQRKLLDPADWDNKFKLPYNAIARDILPRFQTRTIEWAKAEANDIPFYVPPHLREV